MPDAPASGRPTFRRGVLKFPRFRKKTHEEQSQDDASPAEPQLAALRQLVQAFEVTGHSPSSNVGSTSTPQRSVRKHFVHATLLTEVFSHDATGSEELPQEPAGPAVFKRNRFGRAPAVCAPWEGKVASQMGLSGFVITSPTQEYVPQMPKDVNIIRTYVDGRWGVNEYSRHPQWSIEEMTHVACIPRSASPPDIPDILFTCLQVDKHWEEEPSVAVQGLGLIRSSIRKDLADGAATAIRRTEEIGNATDTVLRYARFLAMLLRQVVDRMNYLPMVATRSLAVAAHIQRLCLELAGLRTYVDVVVPRIESSGDFSASVLDVVGGFLREGAATQTWHRIGIPYWVLQPVNASLAVWRIVQQDALPYDLAREVCDPPILHTAGAFVGVSNLTGNWISSMLVSVSKHVAGSHLSSLQLTSVPDLGGQQSGTSKRPRVQERPLVSSHLAMRPAQADAASSKDSRRQQRRQGAARSGNEETSGSSVARSTFEHPSRSLALSPFIEISEIWGIALRAVGTVPQTPNSVLYFFPPPFLLDTVTSIDSLPAGCVHPDRARADAKVNRYLHNFVRIREFCRTRLFDISLDHRPLTIGEWRSALWGEYLPQTSIRTGGQSSDARRAKRRLGERNEIGALFHKVAHMDSYSEHAIVEFEGFDVNQATITSNPAIRSSLLWESHEVNFRAELLALDTLLVQKKDWMEINRWEREMLVSGVWGPPSSAATVVPPTDRASRAFCWYSPPQEHWETCREQLRFFARVLTRWPGCPEAVIRGSKGDLLEDEYQDVQLQAVKFYVQSFVSRYSRLPIPPIFST
ncbi:hypothetical protein LXA43DRAFT_905092 [Ganoderma leucocontextum]|nr:hypothetical protein LXA43DRAFT_905092 [Ganoderma leucocontextum]